MTDKKLFNCSLVEPLGVKGGKVHLIADFRPSGRGVMHGQIVRGVVRFAALKAPHGVPIVLAPLAESEQAVLSTPRASLSGWSNSAR